MSNAHCTEFPESVGQDYWFQGVETQAELAEAKQRLVAHDTELVVVMVCPLGSNGSAPFSVGFGLMLALPPTAAGLHATTSATLKEEFSSLIHPSRMSRTSVYN